MIILHIFLEILGIATLLKVFIDILLEARIAYEDMREQKRKAKIIEEQKRKVVKKTYARNSSIREINY